MPSFRENPYKHLKGGFLHPKLTMLLCLLQRQQDSGAENCPALCSAGGKNFTAVCSLHSCTEAVNFAALALLGLIGTYCCHRKLLSLPIRRILIGTG